MIRLKIKARLIEKDTWLRDSAKALGMDPHRLSRFLHGKTNLTPSERLWLANHLNLRLEDLFREDRP